MSAFPGGVRVLADDADAKNLTGDRSFASVAPVADARSHDAVVALVTAVGSARSTDREQGLRRAGGLDLVPTTASPVRHSTSARGRPSATVPVCSPPPRRPSGSDPRPRTTARPALDGARRARLVLRLVDRDAVSAAPRTTRTAAPPEGGPPMRLLIETRRPPRDDRGRRVGGVLHAGGPRRGVARHPVDPGHPWRSTATGRARTPRCATSCSSRGPGSPAPPRTRRARSTGWSVTLAGGLEAGLVVPVPRSRRLVVGRAPQADVVLPPRAPRGSTAPWNARTTASASATPVPRTHRDRGGAPSTTRACCSPAPRASSWAARCCCSDRSSRRRPCLRRGRSRTSPRPPPHPSTGRPRPGRITDTEPVSPPTRRDVAPASKFSWITVAAPLVLAGAMVLLLGDARFALFALLSPVTAIGMWFEQKHRRAKNLKGGDDASPRRSRPSGARSPPPQPSRRPADRTSCPTRRPSSAVRSSPPPTSGSAGRTTTTSSACTPAPATRRGVPRSTSARRRRSSRTRRRPRSRTAASRRRRSSPTCRTPASWASSVTATARSPSPAACSRRRACTAGRRT